MNKRPGERGRSRPLGSRGKNPEADRVPNLGMGWGCWWLRGQAVESGYLGGAGWAGVPSPATVGLAGPRGGGGWGAGSRRQWRRVHLAVRSELVLPACLDNMGTGGESLRS